MVPRVSDSQSLDPPGDLGITRVELGVVISHCAMVIDADREIREAALHRPYFDASPASGDVYVDDSWLHNCPDYEEWTNTFWALISQFLVGAANLSKMLYGSSSGSAKKDPSHAWMEDRRARVRGILQVGPALGFRSRAVRDAMEHIDERLWRRLALIATGLADPFVIRYAFGIYEEWWENISEPPLGLYDPASHTVYFLDRDGQEISSNLAEVASEVADVLSRAVEYRAQLGIWP